MRLLLILLWALLAGLSNAHAHAVLKASTPAAGSVLAQAPARIELEFSEPVAVTRMALIGPDGGDTPLGPVSQDGPRIAIALPGLPRAGTYLLDWRVISADGHPVGGTLDFALGAATPAPAAAAAPSNGRAIAIWLVRMLGYVCLIGACGAAAFRGAGTPPEGSPAFSPGPWLLPGAGMILLGLGWGLQGLDLLDAPWAALLHGEVWRAAAGTSYATTLAVAAAALLMAAVALAGRVGRLTPLWGIGSLMLLGVAVASSGHASTAPPQWLARPTVALHVILAAAWLGALWPLMQALRHAGRTGPSAQGGGRAPLLPDHPLARFSCWIAPAVALLVLSGLALSVLQLQRPADLWHTAYGRVLETKIVLVLVLLGLAAWNRWRLTQPTLAGDPGARRRLVRAIMAELALAAAILAVVSLWRFTPPPRSLDSGTTAAAQSRQAQTAPEITLQGERLRAILQPGGGGNGGGNGGSSWHIALQTPQGDVLAAEAVSVRLHNPDAGIASLQREASRQGDGSWQVQLPALPPVGRWQIELQVLIDDFDQVTVQGAL